MSADPARKPHLRPVEEGPPLIVVNGDGERVGTLADHLQAYEDQIAGLQRDVKAEHLRYENLKRDRAAEARSHPLWPQALEVFKHWKEVCRHPKSSFTTSRFELIRPLLEKHGIDLCKLACDGAAFDPYETRRKNGSMKRHDGIHLVFDEDKFEDFCNRAPIPRPEQVTLDQAQRTE